MESGADAYVPLGRARLTQLLRGAPLTAAWPEPVVVPTTGSTNADVAEWAAQGSPSGAVLVAEEQTAGRGRLGRVWESRPGSGLWMSVLLHPTASASWSWLPLMVGVATCTALRRAGLEADLKWPNDVIVGEPYAKLAGILIERVGEPLSAVVGLGINVTERAAQGYPGATCVESLIGPIDRTVLAADVLQCIAEEFAVWSASDGDAETCGLADRYRGLCRTLRWDVTVSLPDGTELIGGAQGIDADGRLLVLVDGVVRVIAAGDVARLRPREPSL